MTSIGNYVFYNCISLTSITIGNRVTSVGYDAFYYCNSLTSVIVKATTPPTTYNSYAFSNASNATLYVPVGCYAAYQANLYWRNFKEIIEIEMED